MKRQGIVRVCKSAGTETWTGMATETPMFDRGFTGHEQLYAFGLINMNGRMYDPLMSSFLSVDAYVQDPTNAQAFNRYAYCGHNPLRYTDPTGWYRDGYGCQNIQQNYDPTARWHSDDPNDVLWGRTVHPCANTSSGYVNGTAVTNTGYSEGNGSSQNTTSSGIIPKPVITGEGYYLNIFTGKIEFNSGGKNLLYDKGLMFIASQDATVGDVDDILNNFGLKSGFDEGRKYYHTESLIKGWNLWHSIPTMATFFAGMTADYIFEILPNIGNIIEKIKTHTNPKVSYKFSATASARMSEKSRYVPITILDEVIKNPQAIRSDPQHSLGKSMYYSTMYKNQQNIILKSCTALQKIKSTTFYTTKKLWGHCLQ